MGMGGRIAMRTDPMLTLSQWLSPAYPVGAFAYSHGLERLVEGGLTDLRPWLEDVLTYGSGASDALFLAAAYHADRPEEADTMCRAFAPSKERLMELELQGAAFCEVTASAFALPLENLTYPVAIGRAAALASIPLPLTLRLYLQAFASNLVTAAQRLLPIGQSEAQGMIAALAPLITYIAQQAELGDLNALSGTAFLADIAAMQHETQTSRIFRT